MMKLCILALLQGAVAFDLHEHPIVDTVLGDLEEGWSEFSSLITQHLQPYQLPLQSIVPKNTHTCSACSQEGTKYLMEHAMTIVQGKCANASANSCVEGKLCVWLSKHPKVAMGMMFDHVRPLSLMQAYCTGKGTCGKPDDFAMTEILSGHQPHEALLNNFDKIDWTNVLEEASDLMPHHHAWEFKELAAPKCESNSKVCPHCMMKNMKRTTKDSILKVQAMCHETQCPVMQKMCPWMKENREVALGMLLSKVQPWKIAKGWCMHKAMKHHGHGGFRHGHHEHGEWHHGHHDHGEGHHGHHHYYYGHHEHGEWHHGHHKHGEWHHGHHEQGKHGKWHHEPEHGFQGGIWAHDVHEEPQEPKEAQETISV